jgi:hypothetical protein
VRELAKDLYRSRVLSVDGAEEVLKAVDALRQKRSGAPNTMNHYGVDLSGASMKGTLRNLTSIVQSVAPERLRLDPVAFAVDYTPKTQASLAKHVDASTWTLNLCLGRVFTGGALRFFFFEKPNGTRILTIEQEPGFALIHRGSLPHRAMSLRSGSRTNVVLWCRERGSTWD